MTQLSLEEILKQKINELAQFLISNCRDTEKINLINDKLSNLKFYEIMLFITFLDLTKIDTYINDFINSYSIEDTIDIRNKIKDYLEYFIKVKDIISTNQ